MGGRGAACRIVDAACFLVFTSSREGRGHLGVDERFSELILAYLVLLDRRAENSNVEEESCALLADKSIPRSPMDQRCLGHSIAACDLSRALSKKELVKLSRWRVR
jgi:hypothetical protein